MRREHPMLFKDRLVRALLDGSKTQTRRPVKPQPKWLEREEGSLACPGWSWSQKKPYVYMSSWIDDTSFAKELATHCKYRVGDLIWVIQTRPMQFGDGKYAIGDDGHVYDVSGVMPIRRKAVVNHNGYEEITLRSKGERRAFRLNRLVCEAFYGPPPSQAAICRHLDGNRTNNKPENLDWGTCEQNSADANASGVWSRENNKSRQLSQVEVDAIRLSAEPQATLAARFGVTQPTISKIKSGKRWRHVDPLAPPPNTPRWSCRLWLEITDVRVERVASISEKDAWAEGAGEFFNPCGAADTTHFACCHDYPHSAKDKFAHSWNAIYPGSWERNDWVWALSFKRTEAKK